MSERQSSHVDTHEHLSVIGHYDICWAAIHRLREADSVSVALDHVLEREATLYSNNASLILIFSQMATVGFNPYGDGSREASYDAYQKGMALAMDVTDSICEVHNLSATEVRDKIVTEGASRKDIDVTDDTSEDDARRALSEAILRMGEEAVTCMDPPYDDLVRHIGASLGCDSVAARHFLSGFGLLFNSSLNAVADCLATKHDGLDQQIKTMTAELDAEIMALLETDI